MSEREGIWNGLGITEIGGGRENVCRRKKRRAQHGASSFEVDF